MPCMSMPKTHFFYSAFASLHKIVRKDMVTTIDHDVVDGEEEDDDHCNKGHG